jgi:signal transduction histidine kinase
VRLGIRTKQIAGVTAIVGTLVVMLSAVFISRFADYVLRQHEEMAQLFANQINHRVLELAAPDGDPYEALRRDPGLQSIQESTLYGEAVSGAVIVDPSGVVVASANARQVGERYDERFELATLLAASRLNRLRAIYAGDGRGYEYRGQLTGVPGSIRIGVQTLLVQDAISERFEDARNTGAVALVIAVLVSAFLAQRLMRPIHMIRSGLTRLGKGELGVTLDLPPGDEFGELGSFFNTVSQRLSADRSVAGQQASLQSAVEYLEDAVALFDPSGRLLFSNPAMQLTLPPEAIGGALQGLLPDGHPYRELVEESLRLRASRGPVPVTQLQPSDGAPEPDQPRDLLVMTHAVAAADGSLVGVLLVARNLTHLSRMQSTLAYSRKLVALGRLTAGIAHEVKNPLNAMMIHLELLRTKIRSAAGTTTPEPVGAVAGTLAGVAAGPKPTTLAPPFQGALDHVEVIESEIRRLDDVVQGFLKFSRPEDLRLQPVEVAGLFEEIQPVIEPEARKTGVRIVMDCPASTPSVNGDAGMLRQAFLNLAINACQAMPDGGTLRLACAMDPQGRVDVSVEDTGVGIPPGDLEKIFDLYFTTKHHGSGSGLSRVYRIVQLHDGEVEVRSTPGHGTTFHVLLPRALER